MPPSGEQLTTQFSQVGERPSTKSVCMSHTLELFACTSSSTSSPGILEVKQNMT